MSQPYGNEPPLRISEDNPFKRPLRPTTERNIYEPGSPWWWLHRLTQKLLDRYERYDILERYALGDHPLPNTDYRYVKALKDLQAKARTNYCELVITATTDRMKVKGFRFGETGEADKDAKRIWDFNDMDYQSPVNLNTAATFGLCYALVSPADPAEPNSEPVICIEDPRQCVVERDPYRITRSLAGLKMWQDDVIGAVVAVLILPKEIITFYSRKYVDETFDQEATLTKHFASTPSAAAFELMDVQPNPLGEVFLVEGNWQPAFGDLGRAEHEGILDIQDRLNHTMLDRLIVAKTQSYRQRWATGIAPPGKKGVKRPPFDPGADILWVTADPSAKFGDFDVADISKIISATQDDIANLAAVSKTPGTYLMTRMVNVSGDTLTQDQVALVNKVSTRMESMGWFYERVMKLCFKYKKDKRASEVEASTIWADPEKRAMSEKADAMNKLVVAGVPLEIAMEEAGYTPDQIAFAVAERNRVKEETEAREDELAQRSHEQMIEQAKIKGANAGSGTSSSAAKPKTTSSAKPGSSK